MSRLGRIQAEFAKADAEDRGPELTDADLAWAVQWDRWDLIGHAGYDLDEVRERYGAGPGSDVDVYQTSGVPRVGSDNEMRINPRSGRPETVRQSERDPGSPEDRVSDSPEDLEDLEGSEDPEDLPESYEEWNVENLRAELKNRQLPADGKKADLIARLEEDDDTSPEP